MQPAIFLDRDGVIIENRSNYVRTIDDVVFYKQALEGLAIASQSRFKFIVVTNQSAVGRGLITYDIAQRINRFVVHEVEKYGGRIDHVYMCPHTPDDVCSCRKPKPGLLLQAAKEFSIDLHHSIMIGDAISDLQAGMAAGVSINALLLTGRGAAQSAKPEVSSLAPFLTYTHLKEALASLLS
jgi:D-glycero-D-manno-heptose 1,7-bisphosphate phosphatase